MLYEPDKVVRNSRIQLIRQSQYVAGGAIWNTPGVGTVSRVYRPTSAPAGCKAQYKAKDADQNGTFETSIWVGICPKSVIDALGLTQVQRDALKAVFGSPNVFKTAGREVLP
jgi:hypothetical protein